MFYSVNASTPAHYVPPFTWYIFLHCASIRDTGCPKKASDCMPKVMTGYDQNKNYYYSK